MRLDVVSLLEGRCGMADTQRQEAFMSALTTEHSVLQAGANATISEAGTRATLYMLSLSSSLVAMGFAAQSRAIFVPFVATVVPAVFLLGLFTQVRLVDAAMEYNHFLTSIARIRRYYRTLTPEAAEYFAAERGRWPETQVTPALRLGSFIAFVTTVASMVAVINSMVAGAGVALLTGHRLGAARMGQALGLGAAVAVALLAAFFSYQRWRFRLSLSADADAARTDGIQPDRRGG
jgi:hypothetical protein